MRGQGQQTPTVRFTVAEVAQLTGQSVRTLRRHIAAGRLPVVRRGRQLFITPAGARVWLGHDLSLLNARPSRDWHIVSVRLYAAIAGLKPRAVRHLIDKGALTIQRHGGRLFVRGEEVDRLLSDTTNR